MSSAQQVSEATSLLHTQIRQRAGKSFSVTTRGQASSSVKLCGPMLPSDAYEAMLENMKKNRTPMGPHNNAIIFYLRRHVLPDSFFHEPTEAIFEFRREVKALDAVNAVLAPKQRVSCHQNLEFPVTLDCGTWLFFAQVKFLIEELGEDRAGALLRCGALDRSSFAISANDLSPPPFLNFFWTKVPDTTPPSVLTPGDILCLFGTQEYREKHPLGAWSAQTIAIVNNEKSIGFREPEKKDIAHWGTVLATAAKMPLTEYEKVAHDILTAAGKDPTYGTKVLSTYQDNSVLLWRRLDPEQITWAKTAPLEKVTMAMGLMTLACRYQTSPELFKKAK